MDTTVTDPGGAGPVAEESARLGIGSTIDGRYLIRSKLGEGGMGTVYRVEHIRMGKIMALKLLRSDVARRKRSAVERFRREAQVVSRLNHPNTISVFDAGETESGELYIVMEYVPGRDLAAVIREETRLEERRALRLIVQVLKALTQAHDAGIIHRDIKPGNIMLANTREQTDVVKILDFGIAKLAEADRPSSASITGGADIVGTPSCMSPEQARGLELDRRSDLYSVTAMLFELIAGRGPFVGSALEVISQHLVAKPPRLRDTVPGLVVSDAVEALIAKGLQKDPNARFQTAEEMRKEAQRILGAPSTTLSHPDVEKIASREDWDAFERSFRRRHFLFRATALLILCAGIGAGGYLYREEQNRPPPRRVALGEELEPNDKPHQANLIQAGKPVIGRIGARSTPGISDRDTYELMVTSEGVLSVSVTAVPNVNLVIEIFEQSVVGADDSPMSMSEELTDYYVKPGRYLIRLEDRRRLDEPDGAPRENSSDPYTLRVDLEPPRIFQEREPNNEPDEAMSVDFARPVLAKAGRPGIVSIMRSGPAPLPTWSVDDYRIASSSGAKEECAVAAGMKWATLRLTALVPREPKPKSVASVQVREGRVAGLCTRAIDNLVFEVRVDMGHTGAATYPIAFIGDQPGGFEGLLDLARALPTLDRTAEARSLIERALELMPRASDAVRAREVLASLPVGESASVTW